MHFIWRFYTTEDQRWRWQKLATDRSVIEESADGFAAYESCMSNACDKGYVFQAQKSTAVRTLPRWSSR